MYRSKAFRKPYRTKVMYKTGSDRGFVFLYNDFQQNYRFCQCSVIFFGAAPLGWMVTAFKFFCKMLLVWGSTHWVPGSMYVPFYVLANIFPPESTEGIQILFNAYFFPHQDSFVLCSLWARHRCWNTNFFAGIIPSITLETWNRFCSSS